MKITTELDKKLKFIEGKDLYNSHIKSHFIYLAWVSYQLKRQKWF